MQINRYQPRLDDDHTSYIADENLARAVNMAVALKRPLLVKGPPGCGKTRLAASVAQELNLPLYEWYVKSTSKARDGLYTIDMVRRLQDAQLRNSRAQKIINYISFGPLGEALRSGTESVVLIDEIDKADIDFPNDLLRELDEKKFTIEELDEDELTDEDKANNWRKTYDAGWASPIIIVTSNDEKELPEAFLRRCLFHYIEFPHATLLEQIVNVNTPDLELDNALIRLAVKHLIRIRELGSFRKLPATSELIDWVRILSLWGVDLEMLPDDTPVQDLPFWKVLFKHQQDWQRVERA